MSTSSISSLSVIITVTSYRQYGCFTFSDEINISISLKCRYQGWEIHIKKHFHKSTSSEHPARCQEFTFCANSLDFLIIIAYFLVQLR